MNQTGYEPSARNNNSRTKWFHRLAFAGCFLTAFLIVYLSHIAKPDDNVSSLYTLQSEPRIIHKPQRHIFYLKTHKTGSTTVFTILIEYCRSHDLLPLLPKDQYFSHNDKDRLQLALAKGVKKYDMVFNHHIYREEIFQYLHNDSFRFTTLRDPFKQFVSSFSYFSHFYPYITKIKGKDPRFQLLQNRSLEAEGYKSFTNNRQSMDLGYDITHPFDDVEYIQTFIQQTEKRFDLVLITDYFDESLVILKRRLHWSTQDIIYIPQNVQKKKPTVERLTLHRILHAQLFKADIALYNHFLARFKQRMDSEKGLEEETSEYKNLLLKVKNYCDRVKEQNENIPVYIPPGKWTDPIYLLPYKCMWYRLGQYKFKDYMKMRQDRALSYQPVPDDLLHSQKYRTNHNSKFIITR